MTPILDQSFYREPAFPFLCIVAGIILCFIASLFRKQS